jgi:hypothetical protein
MLQMSADAAFAPVAFWPAVPQNWQHPAEVAERVLLEGRSREDADGDLSSVYDGSGRGACAYRDGQ